jgi:exonuclease SbcC
LINVQKKIDEDKEFASGLIAKKSKLVKKIENLRKKMIHIQVGSHIGEKEVDEEIADLEEGIRSFKSKTKLLEVFEAKIKKYKSLPELKKENDLWAEIVKLQEKNERIKGDYSCLHNSDCCLMQEVRNGEKEIKQLKKKTSLTHKQLKKQLEERKKITQECWEKVGCAPFGTFHDALKSEEDGLKLYRELKAQFEKSREQIEKNKKTEIKITAMKQAFDVCDTDLRNVLGSATDHAREFGTIQATLDELRRSQAECEALETDLEAYTYYLKAMSKDGLARIIISDNLGIINEEIRKILYQGVGFTIELESSEDGKAIDIFFKHPRSPKRVVEILSGMEKTLAAIAIRAALVNVTTLPRSNVFVLDECFASLDPEYMSALGSILEYLKQLFETVIIITHIETFRDLVDYAIEIERDDNGFARICD